jgi:hypothetical protein
VKTGDVRLTNQSLILLTTDILDLHALTGESVSGILGIGAFGAYCMRIDYQREEIELIVSGDFIPRRKATVLPLRVDKSKAFLTVDAQVHPESNEKLSLLIDTGASLAMLLHTSPADSSIYPPKIVTGTFGYGLGGYLQGFVGRSDQVMLGPYTLPDVITLFQIIPDSLLTESLTYRQGILGNEVLDRFTVTIDFARKNLHLLPTRKLHKRKRYDRSGMRLVKDGPYMNTVLIQHVVSESPAGEAGLRAGDRIVRIGGLPAKWQSLQNIERRLRGRIGKRIRIVAERKGVNRTFTIELRELI